MRDLRIAGGGFMVFTKMMIFIKNRDFCKNHVFVKIMTFCKIIIFPFEVVNVEWNAVGILALHTKSCYSLSTAEVRQYLSRWIKNTSGTIPNILVPIHVTSDRQGDS